MKYAGFLIRFIVLAFSGVIMLSGCIREPALTETVAVIDGWFDSNGYPSVVFTASLQPDNRPQSVADKMIRWGRVTVSDGEETVVLTGSLDKNYFPPYRYYTNKMKGIPGRTYYLTAEYEDLYATASCTMPVPTPIDSLRVKPIEGSDSLRSAELFFTAPEDVPAFYYVTVRDSTRGARPYPSMMGTVSALTAGERVSVPVFNAKTQLDTVPFVPQLKIGQRLEVALCRVSEEVYNFWNSYVNAVMFGGSQFIDSSSGGAMSGNIEGGFGVWSVQGVSKYYLDVK